MLFPAKLLEDGGQIGVFGRQLGNVVLEFNFQGILLEDKCLNGVIEVDRVP